MNKSPQYNQQSKSEVEEICIYQNMERGLRQTDVSGSVGLALWC